MDWTTEEIEKYFGERNMYLEALYSHRGLPPGNPAERARFLAENVLDLGMTDHERLRSIASLEGRDVAMNRLEEMAVYKLLKFDN